jgi:hypothetical protein
MKAGKRTAQEIKQFLEASYEDKPPKKIDDFILDEDLSTKTAKVYYNPQTGEAIVAHMGTKGALDWGNNLAYALGAYEMTPRYKKGKSVQDKAERKYGKKNISTLGHSQGAVLARKLGADTKEIINVNPAYAFEKPKKNEYNIRSSSDVVSGLYAPVAKTRQGLFPNYSKKRDITIPTQSATDILGEHSYNILDRLEDSEIGVGAGIKISSNNIMKCGGRRTNKLGFTADDIDWFGGSQGTAYINRGTNPYGTRGAGRYEESDSDDEYSDEEIEGGRRRNPLASIGRTMAHAINPMSYVLGSKKGTQAGIGLGDATNNYILPATVSAGKPIYDATAMTASTMLTGNPMLGKAASDTLWNEMVAKQGYDPRERQKSQELGELSSTLGQAVAKPYSASLGGLLSRNLVAEEFRRRDRQRRIGGGNTSSLSEDQVNALSVALGVVFGIPASVLLARLGNDGLIRLAEMVRRDNQVAPMPAQDYIPPGLLDYITETDSIGSSDNVPSFNVDLETGDNDSFEVSEISDDMNGRGLRRIGGGNSSSIMSDKMILLDKIERLTRELKELQNELARTRNQNRREELREEMNSVASELDKLLEKAVDDVESDDGGVDDYRLDEEGLNDEELDGDIRSREGSVSSSSDSSVDFLEDTKDEDEDEMNGNGLRRKGVNFEKVKWGTFTRMFKEFKKEHPRSRVKDLEHFANYVIKNKKKFSDKTLKKAHFYKNIIMKGG